MLKRSLTAMAVASAAVTGLVATSAPAYAGDGYVYFFYDGSLRGMNQHQDKGDYFEVGDEKADGRWVYGYVATSRGTTLESIKVTEGNGASGTFQYNILEGETYKFGICVEGLGCEEDYLKE